MIIALTIWLLAFSSAEGYGLLIASRSSDGENVELGFARIYSGLLVISTILLALSLFTSLAPWIGLAVLIPGIGVSLQRRNTIRSVHYYGVTALIALFVSQREINFYDTALYHQQAVKWLAEHGLVRGLALVNFRFGWVSSWFAMAAPLDHGVTAGRVGIVGGLPFAFAVVSSLQLVRTFLAGTMLTLATSMWVVFSLMVSAAGVIWNVDTSLSPDLMAWLLPLMILTILADRTTTHADRLGNATLVSAMACLIKSTTAPCLLYCFALLAWRFVRVARDRRRLASFAAAAICFLALLLVANLITSGCLFFPSPFGCTTLSWSVGADAARSVQALVSEFAREPRHHQVFPLTAIAGLASVLLALIRRSAHTGHLLALSWQGIGLTLVVAPVPRYGLGYFLLPVAALAAAVVERILVTARWGARRPNNWVQVSAALVATAGVAAPMFANTNLTPLLYPRRIAARNGDPIHIVNRVRDLRGNLAIRSEPGRDVTIWIPTSSDQCWDAPLPCTPNLTLGDLTLRNKEDLDAGFVTP